MLGGAQYYTLVASLRELTLGMGVGHEQSKSAAGVPAEAVYGEVRRELSRADRRAAGLLWALMDIYGLGRERIEELYSMCAASPCGWLGEWAVFDRNLRNVIAAHTARTKGRGVAGSLLTIEGDEVAVTLGKSSAADFNLRGELDYIDRLLVALGDGRNADGGSGYAEKEPDARTYIVEKERAIDTIRWEKADSLAEGDTFGAPTILAYLVKVAIIGRWAGLDPATGREMYDKLVNSMDGYGNKG